MFYIISMLLMVTVSIYVGVKCYPKDSILASTLISLGSLIIYGFINIGLLLTVGKSSLFLNLIQLGVAIGLPLVIYLAKYRPNQMDQEADPAPTFFEKMEANAPQSFEEFWNDPNHSYTQGKIILLVFAIIVVVLSSIFSLISGFF